MRVYKRINDVYEVELPDCKKYFQFLQSDSALLGGDVIAIFNEKYDKHLSPDVGDIIKGSVEYCCHTTINLGVKEGLWKKYGNTPTNIELSNIYFRNYVDEPCIKKRCWHIWQVNGAIHSFDEIPDYVVNSYVTYLFPPQSVYHKIMYGCFIGEELWPFHNSYNTSK